LRRRIRVRELMVMGVTSLARGRGAKRRTKELDVGGGSGGEERGSDVSEATTARRRQRGDDSEATTARRRQRGDDSEATTNSALRDSARDLLHLPLACRSLAALSPLAP
jgi:hypothetical protein